ncbi:hypothetical protein C2E23DRAFT_889780 [Lenzites betulinus]|nr:hypothetical protein C2E23DRAFT_889780 [Lenzites betulinus]
MRSSADYVALPSAECDEPLLKEQVEPTVSRRRQTQSDNFILWSTAGVTLTTILSIILFFNALWNSHDEQVASLVVRPNPYFYLDNILRNTTQVFPPVVNFPQVVLHFSAEDPERSMQLEAHRSGPTVFGTVFPDDRQIRVSASVSTLVQFRTLDYAMESCVVNLSLPVETEKFQPDIDLVEHSMIDIWALEDTEELAQDIRGALLARAPRRRTLLATLPFPASGSRQSPEFRCPSGKFTTIELACSNVNAACLVEFWQSRRVKPVGGVYIVQSSTPVS